MDWNKALNFLKKRSFLWLVPIFLIPILAVTLLINFATKSPVTEKPIRGPIIEAVYGIGTITSENVYNLKIGIISSIAKIYIR